MILGRFPFIPAVRLSEAQLGSSEAAPSEAAAKPVILRKFLLVLLSIIAPFDYLFRHRRAYDIYKKTAAGRKVNNSK
jgi:hypothetical protein